MQIKIPKIRKKLQKGGIHINPDIYWELSILIGLVIVLGVAVFGFFLFQKINTELTISIEDSPQAQMIDKEKIDAALEYFSARAQKSVEIINSPSLVADPSR